MRAVFAIPGDKDQRTGGYLYNANVLAELNAAALTVSYLRLPDSFPVPSEPDLRQAYGLLADIPSDVPIIVDGLALGAMNPNEVASIKAPIIALVHHPLGLETGLAKDDAARLIANERAVLAHAAHVIVTSGHTAATLIADFDVSADRLTTALPGFARPAIARSPSAPPLILTVGLLTQRKGHDVLLDALAQVTDLDWRAEVVGRAHDPAVAQALLQQSTDLDLDQRVAFRGEIGEGELQASYASATVFALATRYEGYGMVLSEAMLHGLPIVSCSVGAVPETVSDAGCLVPPDDPGAFADALRSILTDPKVAATHSKRAFELAKDLPTWQETAATVEDVIETVGRRSKLTVNLKTTDTTCLQ